MNFLCLFYNTILCSFFRTLCDTTAICTAVFLVQVSVGCLLKLAMYWTYYSTGRPVINIYKFFIIIKIIMCYIGFFYELFYCLSAGVGRYNIPTFPTAAVKMRTGFLRKTLVFWAYYSNRCITTFVIYFTIVIFISVLFFCLDRKSVV